MIICVKQPKLDKVNKALFKIIAVTNDADVSTDDVFNMTELLPPADLFMSYNSGELSKKKFLKKYAKFLETKDTNLEYSILTIGMALNQRHNICFTANDKEYRIGYVKVLANYIGELFGVEVKELDEVNEDIKFELDSYSKKERKILKRHDEELSKKERKFKSKLVKSISKSIDDGITEKETYEKMDRKFAIDQLAMVLLKDGIVKADKKTNGFKDIDVTNLSTVKPFVEALFIASEESKPVKKIVKSVFESHDIKFKKKSCKKMDSTTFISLYGEIYGKLLALRTGIEE